MRYRLQDEPHDQSHPVENREAKGRSHRSSGIAAEFDPEHPDLGTPAPYARGREIALSCNARPNTEIKIVDAEAAEWCFEERRLPRREQRGSQSALARSPCRGRCNTGKRTAIPLRNRGSRGRDNRPAR